MTSRTLAVLLLPLVGCYFTVRAGPARTFEGESHGVDVESVVGIELPLVHKADGMNERTPKDQRLGVSLGLGGKQAYAAGAEHGGAFFEVGGMAFLPLPHDRDDEYATQLRADVSTSIGSLSGVEGSSDRSDNNIGTFVRVLGVISVAQHFGPELGYALRLGAGILANSVTIGEVNNVQQHEGSYSPIVAFTFVFTPITIAFFKAIFR